MRFFGIHRVVHTVHIGCDNDVAQNCINALGKANIAIQGIHRKARVMAVEDPLMKNANRQTDGQTDRQTDKAVARVFVHWCTED